MDYKLISPSHYKAFREGIKKGKLEGLMFVAGQFNLLSGNEKERTYTAKEVAKMVTSMMSPEDNQ